MIYDCKTSLLFTIAIILSIKKVAFKCKQLINSILISIKEVIFKISAKIKNKYNLQKYKL
ncbi:hypothetical protein CAPN004_11590 [Capnocytophaga cynodegmi]|nr:hypothetical protein CAPN004_11590 [Capnocytophaga cynodegmi]